MLVTTLVESLKSFDCNLFVSAHPVRRVEIKKTEGGNREGGVTKYESLVTFGPKVESMIMPAFDEVWYFDYIMDANKDGAFAKRTVYTRPSAMYNEAKTAIDNLPSTIDITNKSLYEQVKQYL
jgi:hypothetical protein